MIKINKDVVYVGFAPAIKHFFIGYFDFKGKTTRAGYWWVMVGFLILSLFLIPVVGYQIAVMINMMIQGVDDELALDYGANNLLMLTIGVLVIYLLFLFIPTLALHARRCRDAGLRGRGFFVLWIVSLLSTLFASMDFFLNISLIYFSYRSGADVIFVYMNYIIGLFFFILTLLPSDFLTTSSKNKLVIFFLRTKDLQ